MQQSEAFDYGVYGEEIASDHLLHQGFEILNTRYKTKYGEIDLIAKRDNLLVFVEVKARNAPMHLDLIDQNKIKRTGEAALFFLGENPHYSDHEMRFDLIIIIDGEVHEHLENAWCYEY